jgi:hypothetical protein
MGMFDTIHLEFPLVCPACGGQEHSFQTHAFEDVMADYRIGSLVRGGVLTGIVQERFWCSACHKEGVSTESPVYLVIWHSILAGVEQDAERAEARMASVDRLDLIGWLDEAQRNETRWKRHFYRLFTDVSRWSEHLAREKNPEPAPEGETGEQAKRHEAFARLWRLPEEILSAPDPLAAIIEKNKPGPDEDHQDGTWD